MHQILRNLLRKRHKGKLFTIMNYIRLITNVKKVEKSLQWYTQILCKLGKELPWVKQASDGSSDAFCKLCHANIAQRLSTLKNHESSAKHIKRIP